jgi:hypothetical protein
MSGREYNDELNWLALAYIAGELEEAEAEAFELRLADDQVAREAVAQAVELTQTIAAAESQCGDLVLPAARKPATRTSRLSWMAIGGLASVVAAALWTGLNFGNWTTAKNEPTIDVPGVKMPGALASAWSETRQALSAASDVGPLHPISAALNDDDDQTPADYAADEFLVADTPSWMTAAVEGLSKEREDGPVDDGDAS